LLREMKAIPNNVTVRNDISDFIKQGGDVFARHVVRAPQDLRPSDEVIVTTQGRELLGVGSALLSGEEMMHFKRGVAIRIRRGTSEALTETDA
jgi:uncharacterized protein with predicted RNA binding PUA domain